MEELEREQPQESSLFLNKAESQKINFAASHLMAQILKSNIGPQGTLKLLEEQTGDLVLSKYGGTLLRKLTIMHPTAIFIARAAFAQAKTFHDGSSSIVALIDAILEQSEFRISDGVHPRIIVKGLEEARDELLRYLDQISIKFQQKRGLMMDIARSAANTKTSHPIENVIVDTILCVQEEKVVDLDRVEIVKISGKMDSSIKLVKGIVINQGFRHPLMAKRLKNCTILVLNVSLEYEESEVATMMNVANSDQMERMTIAQRRFIDDRIREIIEFRNTCTGDDFLLVNAKGIDAPAMDLLSHANINALRRVSKKIIRNLIVSCGCRLVNCIDDLSPQDLGFAGSVWEEKITKPNEDDHFIYVDEVKDSKSVAIVLGGKTDTLLNLTEEAVKSGLQALKHAVIDGKVLPGAGATEALAYNHLHQYKKTVDLVYRHGIEIFADSLLIIPKCLCSNAGHDANLLVSDVLNETDEDMPMGVDLETGETIDPVDFGVLDTYSVKRSIYQSAPIVSSQLLLVDQIIESQRNKK